MELHDPSIINLRDERDYYEEEVRQLRDIIGKPYYSFPNEWGLTVAQKFILSKLADREICSASYLIEMSSTQTWSSSIEDPDKTLRVQLTYLRKKVGPQGIQIKNVYGQGWYLEDREAFRKKYRRKGDG